VGIGVISGESFFYSPQIARIGTDFYIFLFVGICVISGVGFCFNTDLYIFYLWVSV